MPENTRGVGCCGSFIGILARSARLMARLGQAGKADNPDGRWRHAALDPTQARGDSGAKRRGRWPAPITTMTRSAADSMMAVRLAQMRGLRADQPGTRSMLTYWSSDTSRERS